MDKQKVRKYWEEEAEEALKVANHLLEKGDYSYALFFGHLAIEKILKALYVSRKGEQAPYSHNLMRLAEGAGIELSETRIAQLNHGHCIQSRIEVSRREKKLQGIMHRRLHEKRIFGDQGTLCMAKVNAQIVRTVKKFLKTLSEQGIKVETAYIFGSYAAGKENQWSDIDVAVISSDISDDRLNERVRLARLSYGIDTRLEPVPFRPEAFVDEDPLAWEIKRKGLQVAI